MPRERWFFSTDNKRRGPVPMAQLVEGLLRSPDPMSSLVWRHGLAGWTRAGEVPEVERKISPFVASRQAATPVEARPAASSGSYPTIPRTPAREERAPRPAPRDEEEAPPTAATSSATLYVASSAAAVVVLGFLAFLFWPRPERKLVSPSDAGLVMLKDGGESTPAPGGAAGAGGGGGTLAPVAPSAGPATKTGTAPADKKTAVVAPVPSVQVPVATPPPAAAGLGDHEQNLPQSELSKLRGVAGWEGTSLVFTMYNGSTWRVTELFVKPSRMINDQFVDDTTPRRLLPLQGEQAEAGVDSLMNKVAPDRKKPGVNPFDTGRFQGEAGPRPEAYRCPIVGARGYPPRTGS
jgi:GYF domain 2